MGCADPPSKVVAHPTSVLELNPEEKLMGGLGVHHRFADCCFRTGEWVYGWIACQDELDFASSNASAVF